MVLIIRWAQFTFGEMKRSVCQSITIRRTDVVFRGDLCSRAIWACHYCRFQRSVKAETVVILCAPRVRLLLQGIIVEGSTDGARCSRIVM